MLELEIFLYLPEGLFVAIARVAFVSCPELIWCHHEGNKATVVEHLSYSWAIQAIVERFSLRPPEIQLTKLPEADVHVCPFFVNTVCTL